MVDGACRADRDGGLGNAGQFRGERDGVSVCEVGGEEMVELMPKNCYYCKIYSVRQGGCQKWCTTRSVTQQRIMYRVSDSVDEFAICGTCSNGLWLLGHHLARLGCQWNLGSSTPTRFQISYDGFSAHSTREALTQDCRCQAQSRLMQMD